MTAPSGPGPLAAGLRRLIEEHGPISVARFMALASAHPHHGYYAGRDPLGAAGDFVTAPEISQLFGELIGAALAQAWLDLGRLPRIVLAELGPGRGTLLADALRATRGVPGFHAAASIHLVETSPVLRQVQGRTLAGHDVTWHAEVRELPTDAPLFLVANELLDALPIRQFVRHHGRWHERLVGLDAEGGFCFQLAGLATPLAAQAEEELPDGAVLELAPAREALASELAARIAGQGGLALLIDYGSGPSLMLGDTLQAVRAHGKVDPLTSPGLVDLSSHVDFAALAAAALQAGAAVHGPVSQAALLGRLGIDLRLEQLSRRATPSQRVALESGVRRLTAPDAMGELFQAMAISTPGGPVPPGFLPEERRTR